MFSRLFLYNPPGAAITHAAVRVSGCVKRNLDVSVPEIFLAALWIFLEFRRSSGEDGSVVQTLICYVNVVLIASQFYLMRFNALMCCCVNCFSVGRSPILVWISVKAMRCGTASTLFCFSMHRTSADCELNGLGKSRVRPVLLRCCSAFPLVPRYLKLFDI